MKSLIRFQLISTAVILGMLFYISSCQISTANAGENTVDEVVYDLMETVVTPYNDEEPIGNVVDHAKWQATQEVTYDPSYVRLDYPGGDVDPDKGVCIDVVIRAFRAVDKDLQELIHEDMTSNLSAYNATKTDKNIDHRRCKNAIKYFKRAGFTLPVSNKGSDYQPGDIVFWDIAAGHTGIVTDIKVPGTDRYYVVHNICCGPQIEDFLFAADIVEHVRWE